MTTDHPFTRRSFLKSLSAAALASPFVTHSLMAKPPHTMLGHASFGAGGMAWEDIVQLTNTRRVELVAVAEVDLNRTEAVRKRFPQTRIYQDWRKLLDNESKRLDSVNVSTPDHMHAPIAMSAMERGKAVYGQKPLTHDLYETRRLTEYAQHRGLVTQMGIQIHSAREYKLGVALVQSGAIGKIKEVHSWVTRSWGDPEPLPAANDPVPEGFAWNLWLGVCTQRPFIGHEYYHPVNWRKRLDFGTGTIGDMACHIFDPVVSALRLGPATTVRSDGPAPNEWNWPLDWCVHFTFPGTVFTADKTVTVTWYNGALKPPAEIRALLEGDPLPENGSIFVGTQGAMVLPHIARPLLYPDKKFKDLPMPELTSDDHWGQFVAACLDGTPTSASFKYAGPLTETVLLGTVAARFPQTTLKWNAPALAFDNAAANRYIRRTYRKGWQVKGLS
ncbi:MAG TPA: Gfo/Idh/MocA family oxidoreductase [Candidatus Acidoferrum sp.]|nr:Gfo/Idh/MocA family oxidoreductase [Candidatus Acidoferrum sp.]